MMKQLPIPPAQDTPLRSRTHPSWAAQACEQIDTVLQDHAHCEKKAAANAMALVSAYPQHDKLVRRCVRLAQEELRHFAQVHRFIVARGGVLNRDPGDAYVKALRKHVRGTSGPTQRLLDQLLVASLIELRSCERLQLLGEALATRPSQSELELAHFYQGLATAEAGHYRLFVRLAQQYCQDADDVSVEQRFDELAQREAEILAELPIGPRIH